MPVNTVWLEISGARVTAALHEALEKLDAADGEVVLDFSSVERVDPGAFQVMEKLAGQADQKGVKLVLRGVNVHTYKALKLMNLAPRFSFLS
ncbi:MAG TPA: STAS domain-containing protein [Bryobacteraceae bacterium]|nr:STAS domain-containing protein [Bryobacteraceae bacterium]